jgi:hypothetical protein
MSVTQRTAPRPGSQRFTSADAAVPRKPPWTTGVPGDATGDTALAFVVGSLRRDERCLHRSVARVAEQALTARHDDSRNSDSRSVSAKRAVRRASAGAAGSTVAGSLRSFGEAWLPSVMGSRRHPRQLRRLGLRLRGASKSGIQVLGQAQVRAVDDGIATAFAGDPGGHPAARANCTRDSVSEGLHSAACGLGQGEVRNGYSELLAGTHPSLYARDFSVRGVAPLRELDLRVTPCPGGPWNTHVSPRAEVLGPLLEG